MSWTADQSSLLSLLLDEVVGTQEMIDIRQDFCRLCDSKCPEDNHWYYTGSKAEGLNLPGSDEDFMFDINIQDKLVVVESLHQVHKTNSYDIFQMCTDNVFPGFTLLQYVHSFRYSIFHPHVQNVNDILYLSSNLYAQYCYEKYTSEHFQCRRQGPSIETWNEYENITESGTDHVPSIHCPFWPTSASEWIKRPRHFGWPSSHIVASIIEFGFHLVPIGHPHSDTKLTEWRISFSLAERTLVWAFNHVQMQCYAVMKIILKEFIKLKCRPQNFVLCSYFIKTFLFWKYETTNINFWCSKNFRECVKFLLLEFSKCIHQGILRHYFIPGFNLLSVKLTREAQTELSEIMDMAIQCDVNILKECKTLRCVWSMFLSAKENRNSEVRRIERNNLLKNDECLVLMLEQYFWSDVVKDCSNIISKLLPVVCKTPIKSLVIKTIRQWHYFRSLMTPISRDREVQQLHEIINCDALLTDISTCKLWYAFFLLAKRDFMSTLSIVNDLLSNITPFAIYFCCQHPSHSWEGTEAKDLYVDRFMDSEITTENRAKTAWLVPFKVPKLMAHVMPLAIQIELRCFDQDTICMMLSPYVCAYYLIFLCYHALNQYTERDRALYQLVEVTHDSTHKSGPENFHSYNIIGHCLFLAGKTTQARDFFTESYEFTKSAPPRDKYNAASHYLQRLFV